DQFLREGWCFPSLQRYAEGSSGGVEQLRTDALAVAEHGIAHGVVQCGRHAAVVGLALFEGAFDPATIVAAGSSRHAAMTWCQCDARMRGHSSCSQGV